MGKIYFANDRDGYEFISDKGIKYDLLEGVSIRGNTSSDIVFIMLSYDEELTEKIDNDEFVGYMYGAEFLTSDNKEMEEFIDNRVKEYEKKKNL